MKKMLSLLAASCAFATLAPAEAWANPQHERMKRCNQEAKSQALKGDERRQFMSGCLKGKHEGTVAPAAVEMPGAGPLTAAVPAAEQKRTGAEAQAVAAQPVASSAGSREREQRCRQAATEQSLTGAKRKTFISGCMAG
ncbi:MAG: PsiF repeat-containing protein [Thauera phenolivorans]|uniref:PsiF repeat-containing protein n=2 Tax=Thauera phenolivorans TaxID=1792543 RepID=A0A7X7LUH5_9RHOO|nr:PsiF repeat-containing protein [Thauera phenolivorans]